MRTIQSKSEKILLAVTVVSLLLVVMLSIWNVGLRSKNQKQETQIQAQNALLSKRGVESNTSANYEETICAEYRKLYQAYTNLRAQHPTNGESYALPGSAKGQVDTCYQPE